MTKNICRIALIHLKLSNIGSSKIHDCTDPAIVIRESCYHYIDSLNQLFSPKS